MGLCRSGRLSRLKVERFEALAGEDTAPIGRLSQCVHAAASQGSMLHESTASPNTAKSSSTLHTVCVSVRRAFSPAVEDRGQ